jgi:hypothetical protein
VDLTEDALALERVTKIIHSLDRSLRSRKLYSPGHQTLVRHQQELMSFMQSFLTDYGKLELFVEPFELKVGESVVYQNTQQQESFAFKLFNDGIRSIIFHEGLGDSEIADFLGAMASHQPEKETDRDAITLFWEKEFEHISYTVADSIVEEPTLEQKSTTEKIDEILDPKMATYQRTAGDFEEEEVYQELKVTLNPVAVGEMFRDRCVLRPEELAKIQVDLAQCDKPERLVVDFVDMVLAVLQEERDAKEYDRIVEVLGSVLDNNLLQGQMKLAKIVLEQVHAFPVRPIELSKTDAMLLRRTLKILWPTERLDLLIQSLNQDKTSSAEDIEGLISLVDPTAIPHLLKRVPAIADLNRRRTLCRGIAKLHKGDLGVFIPLLSSKDPETLRAGLAILNAMSNEKVIDLLPMLIQHSDPLIRKEAIAILRNYKSPKAFRMLFNLLGDPSEDIRLLGLRILATVGDRDIARQLVEISEDPLFAERSMQERKAYYHAIAKIVGDDFVPYLSEMLLKKNWFGRKDINDQYQCATYALGVVGSTRARSALEEAIRNGNKSVRRFSELVLRQLEGGPAHAG